MQTHQLKRKTPNTKRMIVARGGKRGKTAGRGGKGQSARAGNKRRPEWRDIIKRLPKLRGRGVNQNKFVTERSYVVDLADINEAFASKAAITPATLVEKGLVTTQSGRIPQIKILAGVEISKAFSVSGCFVSGSAKAAIEKAGGSVAVHTPVVVKKVTPAPKTK
ncbi:MAG: uL15 family ribosomal protein [Patescibacteria group bacterium]